MDIGKTIRIFRKKPNITEEGNEPFTNPDTTTTRTKEKPISPGTETPIRILNWPTRKKVEVEADR